MNKLIDELQRLYFLDGQRGYGLAVDDGQALAGASAVLTPAQLTSALAGETRIVLDLLRDDQGVRTLVIGVRRSTDWEALAGLYRGLQEDLELPPPAISVSATVGFQLWLSLAEAVSAAEARRFIDALRATYLAAIPLAQLAVRPGGDEAGGGSSLVELVPAWCPGAAKWSAFIDPSMGAMFVDEPGLDMAPNMERQADMLAALPCVKLADFRRAAQRLAASAPANGPLPAASPDRGGLNVGSHFTDPKSFLLAVMNDPSASAGLRLKAAKALLPYFEGGGQR